MKRIKKITRHTFKYFIIPVTVIACILAGTGASFLYLFPKDKILSMVTSTAEKTLKRKVDAKDIRYSLRGATLTNVTILSSMNPSDPPLIGIGTIDIRFNLFSMIHNKLEITGLAATDINLNISYEKEQWNLKALIDDILAGREKKQESGTSASIKYISFENASINLQSAPDILKPLAGKYLFNGTLEFTNRDTLTLSDFSLLLPEGRGSIEGKNISLFPLSANFAVKGAVKANRLSLGWIYRWAPDISLPYTEVTATFSDLTLSAYKAEGAFSGSSYLKNKTSLIADGKFSVQYKPLYLSITDTTGKVLQSSVRLKNLTIAKGRKPSFTAESINGYAEEILPVIPYAPSQLYGQVKGYLSSDGNLFSGKLSLADAGFDKEKNILSGATGDITVTNNTFKVEKLPLKLNGQNATVSAAAHENFLKDIVLNISINSFTLPGDEQEQQQAKKDSAPAQNGSSGPFLKTELPMTIRGTAECAELKKGIITVKNVEANYLFSGRTITVPRFRCSFLDSSIIGSGSVDLSGPTPVIETKLSADNFRIQRLGDIKKDLEGRFFGIAKTRISLSFKPLSSTGLMQSVNGKLDFSINNGKVANTGIQNALGVWLDPLKYKLKDIEFNTISGSISILSGDLNIRSLIFNSPDIRVMFDGTLQSQNKLDTKMVLEFNDNFIQDIPNPARIIALSNIKKGKWYTINRSVKGDMTQGKYDVAEIK